MKAQLILFLAFSSTLSFGQSNYKHVPKEYEGLSSSPWVFRTGDTLVLEADSIFIVNADRYKFYKRIHKDILSNDDSTCSNLLNTYESRLELFDARYQELAKNSHESQMITLGLLEEARAEVEEVQINLSESVKDLEETREGLEEAKKELSKAQGQNRKKIIIGGAVGLGIGLLLGILIAL